ncbi:multiple sugar transport system substrate-binding protein [Streptosporangium album]|uniref:Multiple sugar transport system substrate-binding protein n=1 Tax=Streptosporangium album TaxID=47479 RepID=A0A7W7RRG6_9ACTN|nr:sugar ABC transporter substrate-binding protein [Streptosporangium album]MBB4936846.1 multiple sugar transport system substrate-binding protein [Streptosporangium album]
MKKYAVGIVALGLVLAGCGRSGDGVAEQAKDVDTGKATGEVTVWAIGAEGEALGAFAKDFEVANPGITVKVTPLGWDVAHDKITAAIAGNATPDVTMLGSTWMGEMAKTGALEPTPGNLIDKSVFFPGAWGTVEVEGTAYGVPWYVETRALYYRKDLAEKAGVKPPTTWEETTSFVKALKDRGGASLGVEQNFRQGSWQEVLPLVWQAGGEIISDGKWTLDTPQMIQALKQYGSFFESKLSRTDQPTGAFPQTFVKGKVGAFYSGPWMIAGLEKEGGEGFGEKLGVAPYPRGSAGGTSLVGGSDMVVFKNSKNREAAWKFLGWLTDPKVQATWYTKVSALPSVEAAWQDPALTADGRVKVFGDSLKDAKAVPAVPTWEQVAKVMETEIEKMALGKQTAEETAKAVQAQAETIGTGV